MHHLRISKYNPKNRNEQGHYLLKDWTSYSDIGEEFPSGVLNLQLYEEVESKYIKAIFMLLKEASIDALQVIYIENYENYEKVPLLNSYIDLNDICKILKPMLRNQYWCILFDKKTNTKIHVGHDYYIFISISLKLNFMIAAVESLGLYIEKVNKTHFSIDDI